MKLKFPFIVLLSGLYTIALNTNLMKVALPFFMEDFQIDTTRLIWITISYTFFQAVFTPVLGKLGDAWEHNKIILGGYIIFLIGSIVGVTATGFYGILLGRSIQGIGAAAILPNTIISVPAMFPPERRGWAIGLMASTAASAAFIGPALGGFLMEIAGWRSLFMISIPIILMIFTLFFSYTKKRKQTIPKPLIATDLWGAVNISAILGCWIIMLNVGVHYGWVSTFFLALIAVLLVLILLFYLQGKKYEHYFININLFLNKHFRAAFLSGASNFAVVYGINFVLPLLMAIEYGMSPGQIGLIIALANIARFLVAPFSGSFSDRYGSRLPVQIGFILRFLALFLLFSFTRAQFSGLLYLGIVLIGAGTGFVGAPTWSTVQENSPQGSQGAIMGFYSSIRHVNGMVGQIILGLILQPLQKGMFIEQSSPLFNRAFGFIMFIVLLGFLSSRALPGSTTDKIGEEKSAFIGTKNK